MAAKRKVEKQTANPRDEARKILAQMMNDPTIDPAVRANIAFRLAGI